MEVIATGCAGLATRDTAGAFDGSTTTFCSVGAHGAHLFSPSRENALSCTHVTLDSFDCVASASSGTFVMSSSERGCIAASGPSGIVATWVGGVQASSIICIGDRAFAAEKDAIVTVPLQTDALTRTPVAGTFGSLSTLAQVAQHPDMLLAGSHNRVVMMDLRAALAPRTLAAVDNSSGPLSLTGLATHDAELAGCTDTGRVCVWDTRTMALCAEVSLPASSRPTRLVSIGPSTFLVGDSDGNLFAVMKGFPGTSYCVQKLHSQKAPIAGLAAVVGLTAVAVSAAEDGTVVALQSIYASI